jgi:fibronectin-binding autotransporter adhesin
MTLLRETNARAGASNTCATAVNTRARLLATACFAATNLVLATGGANVALANDYTVGGGAPIAINPAFDPSILTLQDTVVNIATDHNSSLTVNTQTAPTSDINVSSGATISGGGWGIWALSYNSNTTVVHDGVITTSGNGMDLDTRYTAGGDAGSVTVRGAGSITAGATGIWAKTDGTSGIANDAKTGTVTIDGLGGGINAGLWGILVQSNGTYAGHPGGDVNIGQTSVIGKIVAGTGVYVDQAGNANGDGNINVHVSEIEAKAGYGIRTLGWTGDTTIVVDGNITSTAAAVYGTASTGDQSVTVNGGTIKTTADNALVLDSRFAPDGGNVSFVGNNGATVTSTANSAIWALADGGGKVTVDGFGGGINALTWGILVNSNTYSGIAGGDVNIGQNGPLGDIKANLGIEVLQAGNAFGDGTINITTNKIDTVGSYGIHTLAWTGTTNITTNGALTTGDTAIFTTSTTGAINITNNANVVGGNYGIYATSTTGLAH